MTEGRLFGPWHEDEHFAVAVLERRRRAPLRPARDRPDQGQAPRRSRVPRLARSVRSDPHPRPHRPPVATAGSASARVAATPRGRAARCAGRCGRTTLSHDTVRALVGAADLVGRPSSSAADAEGVVGAARARRPDPPQRAGQLRQLRRRHRRRRGHPDDHARPALPRRPLPRRPSGRASASSSRPALPLATAIGWARPRTPACPRSPPPRTHAGARRPRPSPPTSFVPPSTTTDESTAPVRPRRQGPQLPHLAGRLPPRPARGPDPARHRPAPPRARRGPQSPTASTTPGLRPHDITAGNPSCRRPDRPRPRHCHPPPGPPPRRLGLHRPPTARPAHREVLPDETRTWPPVDSPTPPSLHRPRSGSPCSVDAPRPPKPSPCTDLPMQRRAGPPRHPAHHQDWQPPRRSRRRYLRHLRDQHAHTSYLQ